jgi:hypothetical protein
MTLFTEAKRLATDKLREALVETREREREIPVAPVEK